MNKNKIYNISKVVFLVIFGLCLKSLNSDAEYNYCWVPLALAGAGIVSSLIGRKKSKAAPPPPPVGLFDVNPLTGQTEANKAGRGLLDYYQQNIPGFIGLQNQFGPQLMNQMFRQSNQFLNKQSALELRAAKQAARNVAQIRAGELGTMLEQAPLTRGLMESLSPEQARSIQLQNLYAERAQGLESEFQKEASPYTGMFGTMAEEAYARRGTLSSEEQRATQQQAREAAAAAGRIGGNSAIASEIMNREAAKSARRAEAQQAAQAAYGNIADVGARRQALRGEASLASGELFNRANQFYTTPGMNLLSNAPLAYKLGTAGAASAMAGGPAASGNFDFNMPLNLANQSAGAQNQYNQAVYQTNLANQQAKAQMWSSIGSSMMGAGMNMGGGSYGSMLGGGLSSIGGQTGNTGLYNYGANLYNQNIGYGTPQKAYIV